MDATRKNQVIVTAETLRAKGVSERRGATNKLAKGGTIRRIITVVRETFTPFGISSQKHSPPTGENTRQKAEKGFSLLSASLSSFLFSSLLLSSLLFLSGLRSIPSVVV